MDKLRILHINTLDSFGGASQVANDLIHYVGTDSRMVVMSKTSKSQNVIQLRQSFLDHIIQFFSKVLWKLGQQKSMRAFLSLDNTANSTYSKLKKLKAYQDADIIHLHNLHGGYFDFNALVKIAKEKKIVWTLHDMWAMTGGEAYTFGNENFKKGIGYTPHLNNYPLLNPVVDRRQSFLKTKKKIYKKIHDSLSIVVVSKWLESCFRESFVYDSSLNLYRIYNGVDTNLFSNKNLRTWKKPRLLFFKANNPFKGEYLFTNIIDKIEKEFDLYVVGEKPEVNSDYSHFPYVSDRKALSDLYNQVDILVFPSRAESFGLVIAEAMACGVGVIASDAGGIPEILDNITGYIFHNNNEEQLLEKVNDALGNLDAVRKKGKLAEQKIKENFPLERHLEDYTELYYQILRDRSLDETLSRNPL